METRNSKQQFRVTTGQSKNNFRTLKAEVGTREVSFLTSKNIWK